MMSNPLSGGTEDEPDPQDGFRLEVIVNCPQLERLDKVDVDAEERSEAQDLRKERVFTGKEDD